MGTGTAAMGGSGDIGIMIRIADWMRRRMIQEVRLIVLHIGVDPDRLLRVKDPRGDIVAREIAMTGAGETIEITGEPVERTGIVEPTRGDLAVMTATETAANTEREGIHTLAGATTGMIEEIVIVSRTATTTVPGLHDAHLLVDAALHHARLKIAMATPMTETIVGTTLDATIISTTSGRTLADSLVLHSPNLIPKHWRRSVPAS